MKNSNKTLKTYNSKYYIKKEVDGIMGRLLILKNNFEIFKTLFLDKDTAIISSQFPESFSIIFSTLEEKILLELAKLVTDTSYNIVTINDLYRNFNTNKKVFKEKKYYYIEDNNSSRKHRYYFDYQSIESLMNKVNDDIKSYEYINKFLLKRRCKSIAHNDKTFLYDRRTKFYYKTKVITYEEIGKYIEILIQDINNISSCLYGTTYAFSSDFNREIKYLSSIIQADKDLKSRY